MRNKVKFSRRLLAFAPIFVVAIALISYSSWHGRDIPEKIRRTPDSSADFAGEYSLPHRSPQPDTATSPPSKNFPRKRELEIVSSGIPSLTVSNSFIIKFHRNPDLEELATLCSCYGFTLRRAEPDLNLYFFQAEEVSEHVLTEISSRASVAYIERDLIALTACMDASPLFTADQPLAESNNRVLNPIGIPQAWRVTKGSPFVIIAVLDTGVDLDHKDLSPNLLAGYDFVNGDAEPDDDSGHGTAIAGILCALDDGRGITGVAPACRILPVKVADQQGAAAFSDIISGIRYAVQQGADIINISLGSRMGSQALKDAIDFALARGSLVVAAAGNDNSNVSLYPARYPGVLAVTSSTPDDLLAFDTNVEKTIHLGAPGEGFITTIPGNYYRDGSGTSVAAAFASGIAALVLSAEPSLTNAQLRQILRHSATAMQAIEQHRQIFDFGKVHAGNAMTRRSPYYSDVAIRWINTFPNKPRVNQSTAVEITVENQGNRDASGLTLSLSVNDNPISSFGPFALTMGEKRTITLLWSPEHSGPHQIGSTLTTLAGETETADNTLTTNVDVVNHNIVDLRIMDMTIGELTAGATSVPLEMKVRNVGNVIDWFSTIEILVNDQRIASSYNISIEVGGTRTLTGTWTIPTSVPSDLVLFTARAERDNNEATPQDNEAYLDFMVAPDIPRPLRSLYQQSLGVNIIVDAPWRIAPGRPYVPLMIYVPDKGGRSNNSYLVFNSVRVHLKATPSDSEVGTLIYNDSTTEDIFGNYSRYPADLILLDENGNSVLRGTQTNPNIFQDQPLTQRGRYNILRFSRSSLGVPANPNEPLVRFLNTRIEWTSYRRLFWRTIVRTGTIRTNVRIQFASQNLPSLPGEYAYLDVHNHTISSWYFATSFDPLSPMGEHGGPIPMLGEAAYAIGLINSPTDYFNKVITTDHNFFFGDTRGESENSDVRRPPYGPTSPAQSLDGSGRVRSEWARMRDLFGICAGEEITFSQNQGPGPDFIPIGAHILSYRGQHFAGPWHGGSCLSQLLSQEQSLSLDTILNTLATQNPQENTNAFCYAAHPIGTLVEWSHDNFDRAIGLSQGFRNRRYVSQFQNDFVFRGLQVYNERDELSLPYLEINFNDLNPWANTTWQLGNVDWDRELQQGLTLWHRFISQTMNWAFSDTPNTKFIRKLYICGGSDAHGAFNFSTSRLGTYINIPGTYSVDSNAFARVYTYVMGEGKSGATPEERAMKALADGNSVVTDGPIISFDMDSDGKFNSATLQWHDRISQYENTEGRIGGDGAFGGGRTMLVRSGCPDTFFRYRYTNISEFGSNNGTITSIKIYKDEAGAPNPTTTRYFGNQPLEQIVGRGALAPIAPDTYLYEQIDASQEGVITNLSAFSLGAFTGGDPDVTELGVGECRCYTNPIWAIPVQVIISINDTDLTDGTIPAGAITVDFRFPVSMNPLNYTVEIKQLDAEGNSTDRSVPALTSCSPTQGWLANGDVAAGRYVVANNSAISVTQPFYPRENTYTYVVYFRDVPQDTNGNSLNSIAATFQYPPPPPRDGGGGGGVCVVSTVSETRGTTAVAIPALVILLIMSITATSLRASKFNRKT